MKVFWNKILTSNSKKFPLVQFYRTSILGRPAEIERIPDTIFPTHLRYLKCEASNKVDLSIGVYKHHDGKSHVLNVVRKVEQELANDPTQTKDYLPMGGMELLVNETLKLIFGKDCKDIENKLIQGVQTVAGTGACRLAFETLHRYLDVKCFYCPSPTWAVHNIAPKCVGVKELRKYNYYDYEKSQLNWEEIVKTFNEAPKRSAVILHGCAHNPTGSDFTNQQWETIAKIFGERELIAVFDTAYMGFVSGNIEKDAFAPRLFHSLGQEMLVCFSYSKNMTLYNDRLGVLAWYSASKSISDEIKDRMQFEMRNMNSGPPAHGAKIASRILTDQELNKKWKEELDEMSKRIKKMREILFNKLTAHNTPGDWSFIIKQRGLFTFTKLTKKQIQYLEDEHNVFMVDTGRMNVAALTEHNMDHVVNAVHDTVTKVQ